MRERSITSLAVVVALLSPEIVRAEPDTTAGRSDGQAATGAATDHGYPPLDEQDAPVRARYDASRAFAHPTSEGLIGGVHAVDASSGWPSTFRLALQGSYFGKDGFTARNDAQRFGAARLTLNVTPIEHLELGAQLVTQAARNRTTEPRVLQVVGDVHLLAKGYARVQPWLALGGDAELALLNGVGSIGVVGRATTVGLRASATADLRAAARARPLIARFNLRYLFDNSGRLARGTEDGRYAALGPSATPRGDEYRHLLTPAERFGLQVNRVDRVDLRLGMELPLLPRARVHVSPQIEWSIGLPVNRQGYDCVTTRVSERDGCLADRGFSARPSALTLGVRVQPWLPGLGVLLAADLATGGHRTFVRELAPQARYLLHAGLSYAYDPRPPLAPRARVERVEIPADTRRGHVVGQVVEMQGGGPIPGAILHFEGAGHSDMLAADDGTFRSAALAPGAQGVRIRAPGHQEALCVAVVPTTGGDVNARCELTRSERIGAVHGRVLDARGQPVAGARIGLSGPRELIMDGGPEGTYAGAALPAGRYALRIEAPGFFPARAALDVVEGRDVEAPAVPLVARPHDPLAVLTQKRIVLRRPLRFLGDTASLQPDAAVLLAEIAALLEAHPEITLVEVQAHVDATGNGPAALALTEQRARAVREALETAGVASERLSAVGLGAARPLVPNITAQNRARNRRIELVIKSRAAAPP